MSVSAENRKRLLAIGATAAVVMVAFAFATRGGRDAAPETPEQCIERMFEALQAGDVEAYLSCFDENLQRRLRHEVQQGGERDFASYLRSQAEELKGWAIRRDLTEELESGRVRIVVERVYAGRPWERQAYRLQNTAGVWKVYHIEPAELFEPPVPYGTPAFPDAAPPQIEREQAQKRGAGGGRSR